MTRIADKIRPKRSIHAIRPKNSEIILKIRGIENQKGKIMVALFDSKNAFPDRPCQRKTALISSNLTAEIRFENLEDKDYAISVLHSEVGHGKPKLNFLGMPTEKYGFSNNKYGMFGKTPAFEQAKFKAQGKTSLEIWLRNIQEVL